MKNKLVSKVLSIVAAVIVAQFCRVPAWGQQPVILDIDVQNQQAYVFDGTEYARLASNPNQTPNVGAVKAFAPFTNIGDIVAVNGQRVKGTWVSQHSTLRLTPTPPSGSMMADVDRFSMMDQTWEILLEDGTQVGSIMATGFSFGASPPGSPTVTNGGNFTIVGGTGAFVGVRGQISTAPPRTVGTGRNASISEDPVNRRNFGRGTGRVIVQLMPMTRPEVIVTATGPAVVHSSDFTAVTAARPARAGEILTLYASGLGPTRPGVSPGQPFPANPPAQANSPIEVRVNGVASEVLYAGGYPGATDAYQVNFRLPTDSRPGTVSLQLSAAWITGGEVRIPIQ